MSINYWQELPPLQNSQLATLIERFSLPNMQHVKLGSRCYYKKCCKQHASLSYCCSFVYNTVSMSISQFLSQSISHSVSQSVSQSVWCLAGLSVYVSLANTQICMHKFALVVSVVHLLLQLTVVASHLFSAKGQNKHTQQQQQIQIQIHIENACQVSVASCQLDCRFMQINR